MTKSAVGATDVASLLAATLGAISSEDASIRDRLQQLEASITKLQNMRHPEVKEATTQTNESGSPEFEALKERVIELEREYPGDFEKIHDLVKGDNYRRVFQETGDLEEGVWSAGTCMGLIDDIPTCLDLTNRIVADAEDIIRGRLQSVLV